MAITDPLVLPPGRAAGAGGGPARGRAAPARPARRGTTRSPGRASRTPSRIVDAGAAELLAEFRAPRHDRRGRDPVQPRALLDPGDDAGGGLSAAGAPAGLGLPGRGGLGRAPGPSGQSLEPGEEIAGFEVVEACRAGGHGALPGRAPKRGGQAGRAEDRAAQAAGRSAGDFRPRGRDPGAPRWRSAPRLLAARRGRRGRQLSGDRVVPRGGPATRRRGAAAAWGRGRTARPPGARPGARRRLRPAARRAGVVHGDVHRATSWSAAGGAVRLIDFGLRAGPAGTPRRRASAVPGAGAWPSSSSPSTRRRVLAGQHASRGHDGRRSSTRSAALLYFLLTGAHYRDFSLEKDTMLRQIAEEPPLPFAERGVEPWPEVEAVLARALAKDPEERFPSMAALAASLRRGHRRRAAAVRPTGEQRASAGDALLARVLDRLRAGGEPVPRGLPGGAAAVGQLRRGGRGLRALPDRAGAGGRRAAVPGRPLGARAVAGGRRRTRASTTTGIAARPRDRWAGSPPTTRRAARGPVSRRWSPTPWATSERSAGPSPPSWRRCASPGRTSISTWAAPACCSPPRCSRHVARGRGGGRARHPSAGAGGGAAARPLAGRSTSSRRSPSADEHPAWIRTWVWPTAGPATSTPPCAGAGPRASPRPERLEERLAELAGCARSWGRGLRWRWRGAAGARGDSDMPGWCNGSAGFVHLWTLAHRELGDPSCARLAEGAAWNTWEAPESDASRLLRPRRPRLRPAQLLETRRRPGVAGAGEGPRRAGRRGRSGSASPMLPDSLYKGEPGVAVLAADLARPEAAAQPFFDEEGW